jgi:hypothetical protein
MVRLDDLIGKEIIFVPKVPLKEKDRPSTPYKVKLHGVETGGIWIESKFLTKLSTGLVPASQSPVFFYPFSAIEFVVAASVKLDGIGRET